MLRTFNPAKDCHKRMRIERAMLNFHPGPGKHASSPRKIDAIDRAFLFGNALQPSLHWGSSVIHPGISIVGWYMSGCFVAEIPFVSKSSGASFLVLPPDDTVFGSRS